MYCTVAGDDKYYLYVVSAGTQLEKGFMAKTITVDGEEYIKKSEVKSNSDGPIKIVILHGGWVMAGSFKRKGSDCTLHNASVIRSWGTAKGLSEIAVTGPTSTTKLDKTNGLVQFDYSTVIAMISCDESKWDKVHEREETREFETYAFGG